ncbi:MAG TPA: hypothetical protein VKE94_13920, partial [Gemmataceae bacterium]|nr:hypothetical protein [Gemmataceae bacterium]
RMPGERFGDFCQRMGLLKLQTMLSPAAEGYAVEEETVEAAPTPAVAVNGSTTETPHVVPQPEVKPALAVPSVQAVAVELSQPQISQQAAPSMAEGAMLSRPPSTPALVQDVPGRESMPHAPVIVPTPVAEVKPERPAAAPAKRAETFLAGPPGEERPNCAYRFNSDGSVRETVVYFYGDDLRASQATAFDPLRREAIYQGRVEANRLFAARKLSDTLYVGDVDHEHRDLRREYRPDESVAQTIVFYYQGDRRASEAPSGAPIRRQVTLDGTVL